MSKITPGWQRTSVLESVFDQLSDALILYDPEFRITGVNRSAEKLFGVSSEEMLGKHCQDIFKCSLCEPGCGVLVGLNQSPAAPNCTVAPSAMLNELVVRLCPRTSVPALTTVAPA